MALLPTPVAINAVLCSLGTQNVCVLMHVGGYWRKYERESEEREKFHYM